MSIVTQKDTNVYKLDDFTISILAHKNNKREMEAVEYKPLSIASPDELITALNTYHCVFADLKDGKRDDPQVLRMIPVIKLDVDAEGGALKEVLAILDEIKLEYVIVPSQSDIDYKRHIIVFCTGVYHSDNPLQLKAGYAMQVDHFLTETGIDISWLDSLPLYATSGYLAPASCGSLTVAKARTKSKHHAGKKYELLDLEGNGIVVPEKADKRTRSTIKGLEKVKGEKFDLKDVDAGKVNILVADNTIYQYGKLVKIADVVAKIKKENKKDVIYGGFGCPSCNKDHTMDPKTTPYAFAFISNGNNDGLGGDVMFKCSGNACADKPLSKMDTLEASQKATEKANKKRYKIYRVYSQDGTLKVAIYDRGDKRFISPTSQSKDPVFAISGGVAKVVSLKILKKDADDYTLKKYLYLCDEVEIIRHGWKAKGFKKVRDGQFIFYDAPVPKFTVKAMNPTPIVEEALSIFKRDHKTAEHSTALVIMASYLFGTKQPMAVLALVGDPAAAKTFYAQELIKEYWGSEWVGSIAPDEHNWGDVEYGKRHICYNDVDRMTDQSKRKLIGKVKRKATEGEDGTLNMKGGAIKKATPTSQSITSNYAEALPVDAEGKDRRIYIPVIDNEAVDPAKMAKAFDPKQGGKEATKNRHDLICYLYKIWGEVKKTDSEAVKELLFVRVPMTDVKQDVMTEALSDGKALIVALGGKDDYELDDAISPYIKDGIIYADKKEISLLDHVTNLIIEKRVDAGDKWFLPQELLKEIRGHMTSWKHHEKPMMKDASLSFIGKPKFAPLSVKGVSGQKGVKIQKLG